VEGCVWGVVLSFCPGSGASPKNTATKIATIAMGIQIFLLDFSMSLST
jgi:hypothetical protein